MQFEDPKSILEAAAAKPARGLDAHALVRQGARLRRARLAAVAAGVAVVVTAASASFGVLADGRRGDAGPGPAAPSEDGRCRDLRRADLRFRRDLVREEAEEIARVADALLDGGRDAGGTTLYGRTGAPRRLYISGIEEEHLEDVVRELEEQIEAVTASADEAARADCPETEAELPSPDPGEPSPAPEPTHTVTTGEDAPPQPLAIVLRHAECRNGTAAVVGVDAEFADATKWCRFVLRVDNDGDEPVTFEIDDQMLWATNGHSFTPWTDAMRGRLSRRLFDESIPGGARRTGQLVFLLPPREVPASLDLQSRPKFWTLSLPLDYDCPADLRDEPRRRCVFVDR
ncbi:MAG TPA: DUF4352 domain-containing protein [Actinomycetota bacterium]|nr:DUF4352 domain-containing protein [Actinomycetota bacterium]